MARVYKARDPLVDRIVALKVLSPERAVDPEWIERFTREARALARLNHPHIVQVHRFGISPQPHLVMEFVDGVNLRQAMQEGGLSVREALVIVPKLCDALHFAHEHGVLHRDIKPENVLVDTEGRVKVVDFGLAKLRDDGVLHFTLTQSGARLGTLAYMAPEQVENPSDVDHRADIYSLGVVLYEMLTGELPLGRFPSPSEANGTDPRLDAVVLRTLEKKKENRFADAETMRTELESAAEGPPPSKAENWNELNYEYRSRSQIGRWPLLHVAFGKNAETGKMQHARGMIAIGNVATGFLSLGVFARGLISFGVFSVGLISSGVLSVGVLALGVFGLAPLCSAAVVAVAPYAFGVNALGWISAGVKAFGKHTADIDGPISLTAATVADRWYPSLTNLQIGSVMIGMTVFMLCAAAAAWKASNRRVFVLYVALSLIGPISLMSTVRTKLPTYTELYQKQEREALRRAEEKAKEVDADKRKQSHDLARHWITEVSRTDDSAAKEQAISEMLNAVRSDDPEPIYGALSAFTSLYEIRMDRSPFREPLRRLVGIADLPWEIRGLAITGLFQTRYEKDDVATILGLVESEPVEHLGAIASALGVESGQDFTGTYAAPMLRILQRTFEQDRERPQTRHPWDTRDVLRVLWGARVTPEIESLLVEWSVLDSDEQRQIDAASRGYNVFYFSLSVLSNKSSISVQRLVELARNADTTNIAGRCLWGMKTTVPDPADQRLLASSVIDILKERNDGYLWRQGLGLLELYAAPEHLPALRALASLEELPGELRQSLGQIIARLSP